MAELLDLFIPTVEDGLAETSNPDILSGSSVTTYLRCGKQWEYAHVLQLKRPPSIKQGLGIAAHEAVALNLSQKVDTYIDLPEEEVVQKFVDDWNVLSVDMVDVVNVPQADPRTGKMVQTRKETKAQAYESGIKAVMRYHESVGTQIQPVWVERQISFRLNDEIEWTGIFDSADDRGRLRDAKFVSKRPSDAGSYMIPMIGYSLGYRQISEDPETEVVLDYIVRTQDPYYLPLASGGPISDMAIAEFARIVTEVRRGIDAGIFNYNGLQSFACSWCGYADICPAYRAANGGRNA
jgi:hypothetical protein